MNGPVPDAIALSHPANDLNFNPIKIPNQGGGSDPIPEPDNG